MSTLEESPTTAASTLPPGASPALHRAARRLLSPVERFLSIEAASGILLLLAAVVAMAWANSPWRDSYHALWRLSLGVRFAGHAFEHDLHFWINDGLMAVFFFVIGLEIRRELREGHLRELRRAALPVLAAAGGMLAPAALYLALNLRGGAGAGWGIPVATDIAFAVGVVGLIGARAHPALRTLLLTLAVADDIGAVLVISLFYASGFDPFGLLVAGGGVAGILVLQKAGARAPLLYLAPALVVWAGTAAAGVHPAVAGVVVGLLTPTRAWREALSPAERLEAVLHGWVAYGIMPLFALANSGVSLGSAPIRDELGVFAGIVLGLAVGKPLGVGLVSWLAVRARLAVLPGGFGWREVSVLGTLAGIGFTMALFIASRAFPEGPRLETAKLAVLVGSALSGIIGLVAGRLLLRTL